MKFRYYITNMCAGCIQGTNSPEEAQNFANCEDFFVVDTETGEWLLSEGTRQAVKDISDPTA